MKGKLLLILLISFVSSGIVSAGTYTFKLVANDSAQVCYLAGGFNSWSTTKTKMTKVSDNPTIFSVDVELTDAQISGLEYKYCAGPDWKYQQIQSTNFLFSEMTEAGDTVTSFQAYYDQGQEADVTIDVLVPSDVFVCYLTGTFNSWSSNSDQMTLVDESVNGKEFSLTIHTVDTTTLEYKFLAGPGWPYEQTNSTNYKYMTDGGTIVCDAFKAIYDPSKVGDITINITVPSGTDEVWVVGSYNGWNMGTSIQATKNADGTYTAVIPQVADIEYKIWNHNDWAYEEAADAEGTSLPSNRVASFETGPVFNITVAYWKQPYEVPAFKVTVPDSVQTVYIAGGFNNWSPSTTEMTKISDNPKVFTFDMELTDEQKATLEYKYLAGPDWKYQQTDAANFKYSEMTSAGDTVTSFKAYYDLGQEADVTINVLVPNDVFVCYLTGSFNGWSSNSDEMTLVSESVNGKEFSLTIHTKDTTTLEYKFLAGPGWPYEQTNSTNYNFMNDGGTVVCDEFKAIYDPSKVGDITINITVPEGTYEVWVVGSYNGWDMGTSIQATKNEDGTYTAIVPQVADIEYKIWCHNDWAYEEAADADGTSLASNRVASFETGPVFNITVAYWKETYTPTAVNFIPEASFKAYSRPGHIIVENAKSMITVYDLNGRVLEIERTTTTFVSRFLKSGIYIVRVDDGTQKVFVK